MKEEKNHDHKLTKLLKFSIFATLMLAPFIAVGAQVGYTTFNKNAKDSYTSDYQYSEIQVNAFTPTQEQVIVLKYNDNGTDGSQYYNVSSNPISNLSQNIIDTWELLSTDLITSIQITNTKQINILVNGAWKNKSNLWGVSIFDLSFTLNGSSSLPNPTNTWVKPYTSILVNNNTLDNAFYDAVDKVQQSDLFNWTQNTAIYNGINGMTTGLGIQTQAIPILLTYWIILTAVYVVFDIVIECFIWLTHIFNPKKLA